MKSSQLFLKIKKDIERYKSKVVFNGKVKDGNVNSVRHIMSKYNQDNFNEIINLSFHELDDEIDDEELNDFEMRIDCYFNLFAPDEEFKEFIKNISLYLTFIAKKPLHPPGIVFSNGSRVYKKQDIYYCTGKSISIKDKLSLCKYCACKQVNTKQCLYDPNECEK
ncbi:MAG: DUF2115 family protein [Methanobacterium sp.]